MLDLTYRIREHLQAHKIIVFQSLAADAYQEQDESGSESGVSGMLHFNNTTKQISDVLESILRLMQEQSTPYFATTNFLKGAYSEKQRDEFDAKISNFLQNSQRSIRELEKHIAKTGSPNAQVQSHKQQALQCLRSKVQRILQEFKTFQIHRIKLKQKKLQLENFSGGVRLQRTSSTLPERRERATQQVPAAAIQGLSVKPQQLELSEEEVKELEFENQKLQFVLESDDKQIQGLQQQIKSITDLIHQFGEKLTEQDLTMDQVLQDAHTTFHNVEKGNKNLVQAQSYSKEFGKTWAIVFLMLAAFLIFYDWVNS